jgi:hypothetical protein
VALVRGQIGVDVVEVEPSLGGSLFQERPERPASSRAVTSFARKTSPRRNAPGWLGLTMPMDTSQVTRSRTPASAAISSAVKVLATDTS